MLLLGLSMTAVLAQGPPPKLARAGKGLYRPEGVDDVSGIHYVKLIALLPERDVSLAEPNVSAGFTFECREYAGKRSLHWLVRFSGSSDFSFQRPVVWSPKHTAPDNLRVDLTMHFEGYIRSKRFKRRWEVLPTGEFRYRNSGLSAGNLDDPICFTRWLRSLPNLGIGYTRPVSGQVAELVFPLRDLVELADQTPAFQP